MSSDRRTYQGSARRPPDRRASRRSTTSDARAAAPVGTRPRRSRRERRRDLADINPRGRNDRWIVSYADFITLLFAFFTTMYAASTVDARKLASVVDSMQRAFDASVSRPDGRPARTPPAAVRAARGRQGEADAPPVRPAEDVPRAVVGSGAARAPIRSEPVPQVPIAVPTIGIRPNPVLDEALSRHAEARATSLRAVQSRLADRLAREIGDERVALEMDHRGLVISIRETGSFAVGSADLSPVARRLMSRLATTLVDLPNPIRVEGHTDDVPIQTPQYRSNWDLSTARAIEVVAFLVQDVGVEPARLSAAGYSRFRPRFPNDTPEGRARNRRVDLVILDPDTSFAEEPIGREGIDD